MQTSEKRVNPVAAIFAATIVTVLVSASYPYMTLKLGLAPGMAIVAALIGFFLMRVIGRMETYDRHVNNCVQTCATAGSSAAFMVVVIVALEWLGFTLTSPQIFWWILLSCTLGVLLAVPFRKKFIEVDQLRFADGTAVAETLEVLDSDGPDVKKKSCWLGGAGIVAALFTVSRDIFPRWTDTTLLSGWLGSVRLGMNWSLLNIGVGMIIGPQMCFWMIAGSLVGWTMFVPWLHAHGMIAGLDFRSALAFTMWPATGLLVAGGLTSLVLEWRLLLHTFRDMWSGGMHSSELAFKYVAVGVIVLTIVLAAVQYEILHIHPLLTVLAVVFSVPLGLVAIRVAGETNITPVSAMGNMMQVVFALVAPGNITANMCASGMTGSIAAEATDLQQDFKTGHLLGTSPRRLTYYQFYGVFLGAVCTAIFYPLLKAAYGIGEGGQLSAPTAMKWKGFAELLSKGFGALPPGCLLAFGVAALLGIVITVLERRHHALRGSTMGVGIAILLPGFVTLSIGMGGVLQYLLNWTAPKWSERYSVVLASGLVAGESIIAAIIVPILMVLGWL